MAKQTKPIKRAAPESLASRREAAMAQAVLDAHAAGVTDPDKIRKRMLAAGEAVKAEIASSD